MKYGKKARDAKTTAIPVTLAAGGTRDIKLPSQGGTMTNLHQRARLGTRSLWLAVVFVLAAAACSDDDEGGGIEVPVVIASGLDQPRGLAIDDGAILVAVAGRGGEEGCAPGIFGLDMCLGDSGAIIRIDSEGAQTTLVEGLPSVANEYTGVDTDGDFAFGPHDVAVGDDGKVFIAVGGPGNAVDRSPFGSEHGAALGTVHEIVDGAPVMLADLAAYEAANNPHPTLLQSNINAVLPIGDRLFALDAAGNTVFEIDGNDLILLEVFPDRSLGDATFEAVPSGFAEGPDGALYLTDLTGGPFPDGGSIIWRLGDDGFEEYITGFTTAQSIAFDPDGNLYVVETHPFSEPPAGRVLRLAAGNTNAADAEVVVDGLIFPIGIAADDDGKVYISNNTVLAGEGEILRIR